MVESIAIIGLGCRFPGGVQSLQQFWQLLTSKVDAITEVPKHRWNLDSVYDSDPQAAGQSVSRWGGFLKNIDLFDPQFFQISPREAMDLDPQQRLLLEVSWMALQQAQLNLNSLQGSQTGVFIGAAHNDYYRLRLQSQSLHSFSGHTYTGGRTSMLAGRLAYYYGFQGPALVIDTACSSSLVALHLACQSLKNHEIDLALVGGVNVILDPTVSILASKLGTQSPDGRCQAFDQAANGFVRSEGCGVVVLKRLSAALTAGNPILAVIRGSGVNQDGNRDSLTAPNPEAQQRLIQQVLGVSGLNPSDIGYIEAHGTGTPVGDPAEFNSIAAVFGERQSSSPLWVGSVKTNIGHCEAASGMAAVIKTVLLLQHRQIPANLHFKQLNPRIQICNSIQIPTDLMPWESLDQRRYAGINSFGFSGTNAHVILEEGDGTLALDPKPSVLPFQRQRYWSNQLGLTLPYQLLSHPMLRIRYRLGFPDQECFEADINLKRFSFLADHQINNLVIFPASGYVELALAVGQELYPSPLFRICQLYLSAPLVIDLDSPQAIQVLVSKASESYHFEIVSQSCGNTTWTCHAVGELDLQKISPRSTPKIQNLDLAHQGYQPLSPDQCYQQFQQSSLHYGPSFQGLCQLWTQETSVVAEIQLPTGVNSKHYCLHPVLLDAGFQSSRFLLKAMDQGSIPIPNYMAEIRCLSPDIPETLWCHSQISEQGVDLSFYDDQGELMVMVKGLVRQPLTSKQDSLQPSPVAYYQTNWYQKTLPSPPHQKNRKLQGLTVALLPQLELTGSLIKALDTYADYGVKVIPGSSYSKLAERCYSVNPASLNDFNSLVSELLDQYGSIARLIHLWDLDQRQPVTSSSLEAKAQLTGASTLHLIQALIVNHQMAPQLWLVTWGSQAIPTCHRPLAVSGSLVWALGRVIRVEHPELHCRQIDLDPWDRFNAGQQLCSEMLYTDGEEEVAYRSNSRWTPRLEVSQLPSSSRLTNPGAASVQLVIPERGVLESLGLEAKTRSPLKPNQLEVEVAAAGLNFRDLLNALGSYKGEQGPLGREYAGRVVAVGSNLTSDWLGRRVLGLASGSFSTHVVTTFDQVVEVPEDLSFTAAATLPINFITAYQTLYELGQLKAGERLLIHAGAGGVGLAALQLAQRQGAEIWATAGSAVKRAFLKSIGVQQVFSSRSLEFATEILKLTQGEGIDLILNSLTGDFITKGLSLLREGGRFLEIGNTELLSEAQIQAYAPAIHYIPYHLGTYQATHPDRVQHTLQTIIDLFKQGQLQLNPYRAVPLDQAGELFRTMQQAHHIGKLVLNIQSSAPPQFSTTATYLITGGLGGIGLKLIQWLVNQGAKHLAVLSRRSLEQISEQTLQVIEAWRHQGVEIQYFPVDVSCREQLKTVLSSIQTTQPPLKGIFHAAGVLADSILIHYDWERFAKGLAAKVGGTWNLHALTQDLPLDYFVLFSSVTAWLGAAGRGAYACANLFLDSMAHYRLSLGLPCTCIHWGAWDGIGMAQTLKPQHTDWQQRQFMTAPQGLDSLDQILKQGGDPVGVWVQDWQAFKQRFQGEQVPRYYAHLVQQSAITNSKHSTEDSEENPSSEHLTADPVSDTQASIQTKLRQGLARLLGLDRSRLIQPTQALSNYGLDSLMKIELRHWIYKTFNTTLSGTDLVKDLTLADLCNLVFSSSMPSAPTQTEDLRPTVGIGVKLALDQLQERLDQISALGLRRELVHHRGSQRSQTMQIKLNDQWLINFSSNDYLGLTQEPEIQAAACQAIEHWGTGTGASRLVTGSLELHQQLESQIARWKGTETAVIFNSGFQANQGVLVGLTRQDDQIFLDDRAHASLRSGAQLAPATTFDFRHNDLDHLEQLLQANRRPGIQCIVTESIFSMDGDCAPLPALLDLAEHYDALLIVDEAHGVGVFGPQGAGLCQELALSSPRLVQVGTCGKALGSFGAYVACCEIMANLLRNRASSFIYTTSLPPAVIAATMAAITFIQAHPERQAQLHDNCQILQAGLSSFQTSQICPIIIGESTPTLQASQHLKEHGFWVQAIRPPTVPIGTARLRISLSASHTPDQIQALCEHLQPWIKLHLP